MGNPICTSYYMSQQIVGLLAGLVGATALTLPAQVAATSGCAPQYRTRRTREVTAKVDFTGEWEMDLSASDPLGPTLRELGVNRVLAAVVARLSVSQSITQDDDSLCVTVKTRVSESEIKLRFDGSLTSTPGISGGMVDTVSRWLDEGRLETRQALDDAAPDDATGNAFVTVRSLVEGGTVLQEACSVVKEGKPIAGAFAKRLLRRA